MALKTEVNIKVSGNYLRGTVVGELFKTNQLATPTQGSFTLSELKEIASELKELIETFENLKIANHLDKDHDNSLQDDLCSF